MRRSSSGWGAFAIVAMSAIATTSCDNDGIELGSGGGAPDLGPQAVTIRFAARTGDAPAICGQSLGALGAEGGDAKLRDLRYFVHDLRLVKADGSEAPVELDQDGAWQVQNVALLDFEDATAACQYGTPAMHQEVTGKVAAGTYTGVRFKVGVPFELNHGDPTTAPPPLDTSALFWGWGEGYMFFQIATVTTPPSGEKNNAFVVALASMSCNGDPRHGEVVACDLPNRAEVDLEGFDVAADAVVLDIPAMLEGALLLSKHGCSSAPKNEQCGPIFARFGLDYATGVVTPATQTVFRVAPQ